MIAITKLLSSLISINIVITIQFKDVNHSASERIIIISPLILYIFSIVFMTFVPVRVDALSVPSKLVITLPLEGLVYSTAPLVPVCKDSMKVVKEFHHE